MTPEQTSLFDEPLQELTPGLAVLPQDARNAPEPTPTPPLPTEALTESENQGGWAAALEGYLAGR